MGEASGSNPDESTILSFFLYLLNAGLLEGDKGINRNIIIFFNNFIGIQKV